MSFLAIKHPIEPEDFHDCVINSINALKISSDKNPLFCFSLARPDIRFSYDEGLSELSKCVTSRDKCGFWLFTEHNGFKYTWSISCKKKPEERIEASIEWDYFSPVSDSFKISLAEKLVSNLAFNAVQLFLHSGELLLIPRIKEV